MLSAAAPRGGTAASAVPLEGRAASRAENEQIAAPLWNFSRPIRRYFFCEVSGELQDIPAHHLSVSVL
jgi:hypothetical protein